MILAASSPFFQNLLNKNMKKHHHPLIYMKGVKFEDLCAIVDFLYLGEANVFQENLDSFLGIAEELKLKGLTDQTRDPENKKEIRSGHPVQQVNSKPLHKKEKPGMKKDPLSSHAQTSPAQSYNDKVNRYLARYSPRATTTIRPTTGH